MSFSPFAVARLKRAVGESLGRAGTARYEIEDQCDDGKNQEYVDEATHRERTRQTHDPQDHQDNKHCPKHIALRVTAAASTLVFDQRDAYAMK
jgi:hypothetical protein